MAKKKNKSKKISNKKTRHEYKDKKHEVSKSKELKKKSVIPKTPEGLRNENSEPKKIKKKKKIDAKKFPTLMLKKENEIAMDFATKTYQKFNKLVKAIVLFGSTVKQSAVVGSDIDIIVIIDDISINWDQELIAWYRTELEKIIRQNPYNRVLHINTIKLSTWWEDLLQGDPVIINILRYGESLIDFGGFYEPLKYLLIKGKIKSTPEAVYNALQRAPLHLARSKVSELNSIEGLYWAMVDSAHAALISIGVSPPSPEHIPINLKESFVDSGKLKMKYVTSYRDLHNLHKQIAHGEVTDLKGVEIDAWQEQTEDFLDEMTRLVKESVK